MRLIALFVLTLLAAVPATAENSTMVRLESGQLFLTDNDSYATVLDGCTVQNADAAGNGVGGFAFQILDGETMILGGTLLTCIGGSLETPADSDILFLTPMRHNQE